MDLALIVREGLADILGIRTDVGEFPLSLLSFISFGHSLHLGFGVSLEAITFASKSSLNTSIESM